MYHVVHKKEKDFVIASQIGKDGTIRTDLDTLFVITCFYIYVFVFIVCILHFCAVRLVVLFFPFLSVTINIMYRISGTLHLHSRAKLL